MMRGDSIPKPELPIQGGPVVVSAKKRSRLVAANIVDPKSGEVQFHIVSTKFLNVMIASLITLMLCGLVVLALVVYLKTDIEDSKRQIEQLQKEVPANVDTPEHSPTR